jgi:hypothetical protein
MAVERQPRLVRLAALPPRLTQTNEAQSDLESRVDETCVKNSCSQRVCVLDIKDE